MKTITLSKSLRLGKLGELSAGVPYVVSDAIAGEIMIRSLDPLTVESLLLAPTRLSAPVLFLRDGGYGDLLFLEPVLRELARRGVAAEVSCLPPFRDVLPEYCEYVGWPLTLEHARECCVVSLENLVERDRELHPVDLFAGRFGIKLDDHERQPRLRIPVGLREMANHTFPRMNKDKPRLGVQLSASAKCRSYPAGMLLQVMEFVRLRTGAEIFLFDTPGKWKAEARKGYTHLAVEGLRFPRTFLESAAVLSTCDAFLGPDSALVHVAGALGIPTLALYGPFPWQIRTSVFPSVTAMQGRAGCAPCFHHVRGGNDWPDGCPGAKKGACVAMDDLSPVKVAKRVVGMLNTRVSNTGLSSFSLCRYELQSSLSPTGTSHAKNASPS